MSCAHNETDVVTGGSYSSSSNGSSEQQSTAYGNPQGQAETAHVAEHETQLRSLPTADFITFKVKI